MMLRRQFLELLQSGLWGRPATSCFFVGTVQWAALLQLARSQALLGIVFDGLDTLLPPYRPPQELYIRWCAAVAQVEQANECLDHRVAEVIDLYRQASLHPVLLKGQGIARCYLRPEHRQCGDIDVYLGGHHGYDKANRILGRQGATLVAEEGYIHSSYNYRGVMIENHLFIAKLNAPWANRRFQELARQEVEHPQRVVDIAGRPVMLPSPTFDALYIFAHAFKHLVVGGVGLRQLCDWCRLLHTHREQIDYIRLVNELHRLGLYRAAQVFRHIAISHLGLPPDDLPLNLCSDQICAAYKEGEQLLDEIFATGNFGQYDTRMAPRPPGRWQGKWYTFKRVVRRCCRLYRLAPAEVLWQPLALIGGKLRRPHP